MESKSHFQIPFSTSRESYQSNTRTNAASKHCKTSKYNNLKIKFNALKKSKFGAITALLKVKERKYAPEQVMLVYGKHTKSEILIYAPKSLVLNQPGIK